MAGKGLSRRWAAPGNGWRRAGWLAAGCSLSILLASEIAVVVSYAVPAMSIYLFQAQAITVDRTISIADFPMGDLIILVMMWGAPMLVMCMLVSVVEWKVIRFVWKYVAMSFRRAFRRDEAKGEVTE